MDARYRATVLDPDQYLLPVSRYIELNAVRAGLAARSADYAWSSHWTNALGEEDDLVIPHPIYLALGGDAETRCKTYAAGFDTPFPQTLIEAIRNGTNKSWALGDEVFCDRIEQLVGRRARPLARGGDRRSSAYRNTRAAAS